MGRADFDEIGGRQPKGENEPGAANGANGTRKPLANPLAAERYSDMWPAARFLAGRLHWRADDAAVRAKHAAMAGLRAQQRATAFAVVEELAGIDGHDFPRAEAASRTGDHALELDGFVHDSSFEYVFGPAWIA
jgi:hypothetical protein